MAVEKFFEEYLATLETCHTNILKTWKSFPNPRWIGVRVPT